MPNKDKVHSELDFLTDRISTQVRTISFGLIAVIWGILISAQTFFNVSASDKIHLLAIGTFALITMFCDYLQYFFGWLYVESHRKKMKKDKATECSYNDEDWRYRLRVFFFSVKQILLVFIVIWFVIIAFIVLHDNIFIPPNN